MNRHRLDTTAIPLPQREAYVAPQETPPRSGTGVIIAAFVVLVLAVVLASLCFLREHARLNAALSSAASLQADNVRDGIALNSDRSTIVACRAALTKQVASVNRRDKAVKATVLAAIPAYDAAALTKAVQPLVPVKGATC